MTRILFICLGNICRSPMAEFVMKDLVEKAGIAEKFEIASAATSAEEVGNPVYPRSAKIGRPCHFVCRQNGASDDTAGL